MLGNVIRQGEEVGVREKYCGFVLMVEGIGTTFCLFECLCTAWTTPLCGMIWIYTTWATAVCVLDACNGNHDMVVCTLFGRLCWFWLAECISGLVVHTTMVFMSLVGFATVFVALMRFLQVSRVFAWYVFLPFCERFWPLEFILKKFSLRNWCWMTDPAFGISSRGDDMISLAPGCV